MGKRYASNTDYAHLYGQSYYAHNQGMASFDIARLPAIVASASAGFQSRVLDIGGGNGLLAEALAAAGVKTFTVDAAEREAHDYAQLNLARFDVARIAELRCRVLGTLGETYLATCFDVAEHIDPEHLADFAFTLAALVEQECILSISTRPSSAANRFHSSVLPIETWAAILRLSGFTVEPEPELQELRSRHRFHGADANLIAVAHWQQLNPFREDCISCQHYLRLRKTGATPPDLLVLRATIGELLDIDYRDAKRTSVAGLRLPPLLYHVNFMQDWSFLRSLMDVWPTGGLRVLLRRDLIAEPYLHMLVSQLERTGNSYAVISNVAEGASVLDQWLPGLAGGLAMTATEGLLSPSHQMGSLTMLEARKRGLRTICLQHGMNVSRHLHLASAVAGAWDEGSAAALTSVLDASGATGVRCVGSPKFLDALLPGAPAARSHRLGRFAADFERAILIGLGLHWGIHRHDTADTAAWIARLSERNPETLFVIRPHPDDDSAYEHAGTVSYTHLTLPTKRIV